ncbi:hypothetical protein [Sphingomonas sp.]|uniref:hypothetical protein n=1 Tax=Sphingomonas sp. TaxID=28214 RepID=UPI00286E0113|nr:hypothetical protein [Sphingomonas sp.]
MTFLILAALAAAAPQAAPAAPADPHAEHRQHGAAHDAKDCCCKDMKGGKMECCAKHGAGHDAAKGDGKAGEHADHGLSH